MPRFALISHDSPRGWHFDFFLEHGPILKTWALPELPEVGKTLTVESLADHRPLFLDYEGPISGDRGVVARWDTGVYEIVELGDDRVRVHLKGQKISGSVELRRSPDEPGRWTFIWISE